MKGEEDVKREVVGLVAFSHEEGGRGRTIADVAGRSRSGGMERRPAWAYSSSNAADRPRSTVSAVPRMGRSGWSAEIRASGET